MDDWLDGLARAGADGDAARGALLTLAEAVSQSGSWAWRIATEQIIWSANMYRLWDVAPATAITTALVSERLHPLDRSRVLDAMAQLRSGERTHEITFRIVLGDDSVRFLSSAPGRRFGAGDDVLLVGWIRDVTETRQAEREIACHLAVTSALSAWEGPDPGVVRLVSALADALGFTRGSFWVAEPDGLTPRYRTYADGDGVALTGARLQGGEGLTGMALTQREPVWIKSLGDNPSYPFRDRAVRRHVHGAVAIPIIFAGEVLAVIALSGSEDFELTDRLSATLTGIGYEIGAFLARRSSILRPTVLSPREIEILRLAADGLSGPLIAQRLYLSPATVKTHFENIYDKYGVTDRVSAVAKALREGLLT